jgi:hypothetical protein
MAQALQHRASAQFAGVPSAGPGDGGAGIPGGPTLEVDQTLAQGMQVICSSDLVQGLTLCNWEAFIE